MKGCAIIFLILTSFIAKSQVITTFAGCGTCTIPEGDGGPATIAAIPDPAGSIFDKYGNCYFASAINGNRIRKISSSGIITTIAGTGTGGFAGDNGIATSALLNAPADVSLDTADNVYISDPQNFRIRKITVSTGIITTVAGNGTGAYSGDGLPATSASIWGNTQICLDRYNNLYITDYYNQRVRKVNSFGIISTFAGMGTAGSLGDGTPATAAELNYPAGITIDTAGNIYISEGNGFRVRKVNMAGIISTYAGNGMPTYLGDGMPATNAQFAPGWLAMDSLGDLFVDDGYNDRVLKVDIGGIIHNVAGTGVSGYFGDGGAATDAKLDYPSGIAIDPCGNLYISEADNERIRKVAFNATCSLRAIDSFETLSADQLNKNTEIIISPNPATNELTITADSKINEIIITNIMGQGMYEQECNAQKAEINIGYMPDGVYFVAVIDEEGNKVVRKIVKQ